MKIILWTSYSAAFKSRNFFLYLNLFFIGIFFTGCNKTSDVNEPVGLTVSPSSPSFDRTPTISGTTSAEIDVRLYGKSGCRGFTVGLSKSDTAGNFSINSSKLTEGLYEFSVEASNGDKSVCSSTFVSYTLDSTAPTISISTPPVSLVNQNSAAVNYTITYSGTSAVTLLDSHVSLNRTGTASCATIAVSGGTTISPIVSLSQCGGDGTIGITIAHGSAVDEAGNSAPQARSSHIFTVDNTPISSASFNPSSGIKNSPPSTVLILFPEPVNASSITDSDFTVSGTCSTLPTLSVSSTAGATTSLSLAGGSCTAANQTVIVTANLTGIQDAAGNNGVGSASVTYTIDLVGPTASVFSPPTSTVASVPTTVTVQYNEAVNPASVSNADFSISGTCSTLPVHSLSSVSGDTATLTLVGASCSDGQTVIVTADQSSVTDTMGNWGISTSSVTYTIDSVGPAVLAMSPVTATVSILPAAVSINFDQNVLASSVSASDLIVTGTCSVLPSVSVQSVSTTTVNFTLSGGSCNSGQTVDINFSGTSITDELGNAGTGSVNSVFTFDNIGPMPLTVTPVTGTVNAVPGSLSFNFDENVKASSVEATDLVLSGSCSTIPTVSLTSVSGTFIVFSLSGGICNHGQNLTVALNGSAVTDEAGNIGSSTATATFTIDNVGPVPSMISPGTGVRKTMPTTVTVNFDTTVSAGSVTASDLSISGTCSVLPTANVISVSGATVQFGLTASTCSQNQSLVLTIAGADFTDETGNAGSNTQSVTYTADVTGPTITSISPTSSSVTSIPFTIVVSFNENLDASSVTNADLSVSGTCSGLPTASVNSVTGPNVNINLGGGSCAHGQTAILTINVSGINDSAGNPGSGTSSVTYTVDNTGPTIVSFGPSSGAPPASVVITYSEALDAASVSDSDFSVSGSCDTLPTATVSNVSGNSVTLALVGASCLSSETVQINTNAATVTDTLGNAGVGSGFIIYTQP